MTYSVIGLLAIVIHFIINIDVFRSRRGGKTQEKRSYGWFLCSVIAYHVTDALWGVLYERGLRTLVFLDTEIYFAAMGISVLLWVRFVRGYLGGKGVFSRVLRDVGWVLCAFQIAALIVNCFMPLLFWLDESGGYHAGVMRYLVLGAQILLFFMTSVYTFTVSARSGGSEKLRHITICLFGLVMILAITAQLYYPLLPLYSIGYLLGCCMLHTFVLLREKEDYLRALEESLGREALQEKELGVTRQLAYTDALTGVKSKRAYGEAEARMNRRLADGELSEFAVAVFDLNDLKEINDRLGHDEGDRSIREACRMICVTFQHSPVFRIGGDEFAAILEGQDYGDREALLADFDRQVWENREKGLVVVASGAAVYDPERDAGYNDVFRRADEAMYRKKRDLKKENAPV